MSSQKIGFRRFYSLPLVRRLYHKNPVTRYWKKITEEKMNRLVNRGVVLNGPFKGMQYPLTESRCSAFFPKITGSYEAELHPVFEEIKNSAFTEIVDIGCAEGYYACGLSLHYKNAKTYAYDTDPKARELCHVLAKSNDISEERLQIEAFCDAEKLKSIQFQNGLIVSDCEGYEIVLFQNDVIAHLKNCYILIECHDNLESDTRKKLQQRFSATHTSTVINSLDDFEKIKTYNFVSNRLSSYEKWYLYAERRGIDMEWLILEPIKKNLVKEAAEAQI